MERLGHQNGRPEKHSGEEEILISALQWRVVRMVALGEISEVLIPLYWAYNEGRSEWSPWERFQKTWFPHSVPTMKGGQNGRPGRDFRGLDSLMAMWSNGSKRISRATWRNLPIMLGIGTWGANSLKKTVSLSTTAGMLAGILWKTKSKL